MNDDWKILNVTPEVQVHDEYKNWWAAEFIVQRGGTFYKVQAPYKTYDKAKIAIGYLSSNLRAPAPDYRMVIKVIDLGKKK